MKKTLSLIAIAALSISVGHANVWWKSSKESNDNNQLSNSKGWVGEFGLNQGFAQYDLSAMRSSYEGGAPGVGKEPIGISSSKVDAYRIGLTTGFGYVNAFYVQIRSSFSIGATNEMIAGPFTDATSLEVQAFMDDKSQYVIDADVTYFIPMNLSKRHSINVYPAIGWGVHQLNYKVRVDGAEPSSFYKLRLFAPFAGIYFSIDPGKSVGASWGFAFHLPRGKHAFFVDEAAAPVGYEALKRKRHGLSSTFELYYKVKDALKITSVLDYYAYQVYGAHSGDEPFFGEAATSARAYLKQFSATLGVEWQF